MQEDPTYDREEIDRNPVWNIAFILSEWYNDTSPVGWGKFIPIAQKAHDKARELGRTM